MASGAWGPKKKPYAARLMIVAGLVLEDGGDGTQPIAALLHDSGEDGGGGQFSSAPVPSSAQRSRRSSRACSESLDPDDERSWRERNAAYLAHLPEIADEAMLRAALADKVHNARSIVRDYRAEGGSHWKRFTNKTIDDQLWYYRALVDFFNTCQPAPLIEDLRHAISELEEHAAGSAARPRLPPQPDER